jgi:hypothetical protein
MTDARKQGELSETAKKLIQDEIKAEYFGVRERISSKYMTKGIECEQQSIDLLNESEFRLSKPYVKNDERKSNEWITGECDIYDADSRLIRDIKTSWSMYTFPLFATDASDYEWQMRGYMMLWDCDTASVDYCLVDTPEHLIGYEQREIHIVSHLPVDKRVKSFVFERDLEKEERIKARGEQLREYYFKLKSELNI